MSAPSEQRAQTIRTLDETAFDVLVIGGGITGAGIARDAALRGLRTALLEQDDFASGTSNRSSRLVHGGVRYLEHGHLHLVFESSRERRTLLRIAPHLVRPLEFVWPVYRGARVSRAWLRLGLTLYDALALFRNVGRHHPLTVSAVRAREPLLKDADLLGGAVYWDASTDDARLTLVNVLAAREAGAVVLNHAPVVALDRGEDRQLAEGASAVDTLTGERFSVRARLIVNATGPWTDGIQHLEGLKHGSSIVGSKGVHIALPRARVGNQGAITMLHPTDGRVMFTLPAGALTIIGTTETPADAGPSMVRANRDDVRYLLEGVRAYFPHAALGVGDVVSAWAGIRPLAASHARGTPQAASREHSISVGPSGVVSVTGGKLTTYRAMAEEVVDVVVRRLGGRGRRCTTAQLHLPGAGAPLETLRAAATSQIADGDVRERFIAAYGDRWRDVWRRTASDRASAERVTPELPYLMAELSHAVEHELASTLGDLLMRRTRLAFERRDHGLALSPRVATHVAPLLGWDTSARIQAVAAYEREVDRVFGRVGVHTADVWERHSGSDSTGLE